MAYEKKFCQPVRMESQFVATKLHPVMVQDGSDNNVEVTDGTLVTLGDFVSDPIYEARYEAVSGTAPVDLQTRVAVPTTTAAVGDVCVIDLANVAEKSGQGVTIRDGNMIIGVVAQAGVPVRARKLVKDDVYVTGSDNFTSAPTVGQYAVPAANGEYAPSATAVTTGFCAKVVATYTISQGVDGNVTDGYGVTAYRLLVTNNEVLPNAGGGGGG